MGTTFRAILKSDPYHEPAGSSKGGRFATAPVSAEGWDAVQKNPILKAGTKFIAYRVGTSPELKGVNGGNSFGIAAHLMNWMEEGEIKDENIYAHEVTLTKDTGEYEHIGFKGNSEENGTNPQVGRDQYFFGTGYSFPKDGAGFTSKLIKTIPVKDVLKEAEKDTDNAQRIATAIDKAFSNKKPLWDEKGNFSESLGIDRKDMPQIQSSDFPEFTEFAKKKGITITPEQVHLSSLKPTQKHFNVEQAKQLTPEALSKPITVSKDNYVLDGTNRWARNLELNPDGKVNINRMSIPVRKALDLMFSFPKVFSKTLAQVGATQKGDKVGHPFRGNQWSDLSPVDASKSGHTISRGIEANVEANIGLYHKIKDGTATAEDVLGMVDTKRVGNYWYSHQDGAGLDDSKEFAYTEEGIDGENRKEVESRFADGQKRVSFSVSVVLEGKQPVGWDSEDNPPSFGMGNSYINTKKWKEVQLTAVHYKAGDGKWRAIPTDRKVSLVGRTLKRDFSQLLKGDKDGHAFHGNQWIGHTGQTETKEFKAWFKRSKVVDKEGKPRVMYHGTNSDFTEFSYKAPQKTGGSKTHWMGFFFSNNPEFADRFTRGGGSGANVMPVYLSIKKPYIATSADIDRYNENTEEQNDLESVNLAEKGFDGIFIHGNTADSKYDEIVAFNPEQIKSAVGNNGKFDPKDANITKMDFAKILKAS